MSLWRPPRPWESRKTRFIWIQCWPSSGPRSTSSETILWEGTVAEFYAAGATEEQTGYWSAEFFKALTTHYGLTPEQAVYFSTHEEADLKEHDDGVMGHGSFRRLVLQRLLEDGIEVRAGYDLEYCGLTAVDLHGDILNASLAAAD